MSAHQQPRVRARGDQQPVILVADDEVLVRMSIAAYLRGCGYEVIEAKTADEAREVLIAGMPVDILFADIHMPGSMDGIALARWTRLERPDIKIILTSGVARSTEIAGDLCQHEGMFKKPYVYDDLLPKIHELMARP